MMFLKNDFDVFHGSFGVISIFILSNVCEALHDSRLLAKSVLELAIKKVLFYASFGVD